MNLFNWSDVELTPHYARDEAEPYSLPIVVRVEKTETYTEEDAFIAVIKLMVALFDSNKWNTSLEQWVKGRIRKVTRKARASQWENLKTLDHIYAKHNNVEMMVFEPHKLNELNPLLKKLQVQGIDFEKNVAQEQNSSFQGMVVAVNPELAMSTGKTIAQVAHSAQILIFTKSKTELQKWVDTNFAVSISSWDKVVVPDVSVQDAGLTEIPAGSFTVKAKLV